MNKALLINALCDKLLINKELARNIIEAFADIITQTVHNGDKVHLQGFGVFKSVVKSARDGINPSTGKKMVIPKHTLMKFVPAKNIKYIKE